MDLDGHTCCLAAFEPSLFGCSREDVSQLAESKLVMMYSSSVEGRVREILKLASFLVSYLVLPGYVQIARCINDCCLRAFTV